MGPGLPTFLNLFFREAVRALLRHKVRSGLTTLGIAVGIAAVVLVIALSQAGTARAIAELQKLGDNLVWVEAGTRTVGGVRTGSHGTSSLTVEDAEAMRREISLLRRVSPQVDGRVELTWGNRSWTTRYRSGTPEYLAIRRWEVAAGTVFSMDDVDQFARKVLVGRTVREQLFDQADPVGQVVRVQGRPFEVVGVLAAKGQSAEGRDQDDWIFLPYTTAHRYLRGKGGDWLDDILCSAVSPEAVDPAIAQIVALLRQRHAIRPDQEDDFNIRRPDETLKAQAQAADALARLLISVALVSLVVGGVGIMNVMLASVAQRTREIGVRLAVGATQSAIRLQFLGEAVVLSLFGGVLGVGGSVVGAVAFERGLGWAIAIPLSGLAVAVAAACGVGVAFGYYPAWRASRLDPIEALRHE